MVENGEHRLTAADKLRLISIKQEEARQSNRIVKEYRCHREAWALARTLLPIPDEELPEFRAAYERLPKLNQLDTYDALRHNIAGRKLHQLLGIEQSPRRI